MSELKDFKADWAGIWIPKKELKRLREEIDGSAGELIDGMLRRIDEHKLVPVEPEMKPIASELQDRLMQCTIDFFKEKGINNVWSVIWDADSLPESIKEGKWHPYSDSSITLEKLLPDGRIPVAFVI